MKTCIIDKKELVEHNQLSCIDWFLWKLVFNCLINNSSIKFLNGKFSLEDISKLSSEEEFYCYLIANKGDIRVLKSKILILETINFRKLMLVCSYYKNSEILELFKENIKDDIFNVTTQMYYNAFLDACEYGNLEVVAWLYAQASHEIKQIMLKSYGCAVFRLAAENGNFEVAQWLYAQASYEIKQYMLKTDDCYAFCYAVGNYHVLVAKWLLNKWVSVFLMEDH